MVGGASHPQAIDLADDEVLELVAEELKAAIGLDIYPEMACIYRHSKAIPQYIVGHGERLDRIEERLQGHPGLFLAGNAYGGIGFNDCVVNAGPTAARVLDHLSAALKERLSR